MHVIYCVPDRFVTPQVYFCDKLNKKFDIKTASVNKFIYGQIIPTEQTSLLLNIDHPELDESFIGDVLEKSYSDCISVGVSKSNDFKLSVQRSLHVLDDIVQADVELELPALCQRINFLCQIKKINQELRKKLRRRFIIGKSEAILGLVSRIPRYADSDSTILITGETGTGKELFARAFHYLGKRSNKPFITIDCSALPENLVESELFGHVKGAFTNAENNQPGTLEEAHEGTVFFDEIEAMPYKAQSKLLRFLQEREVKRVGGREYRHINVRVIAASNEDLLDCVRERTFRRDLFHRLNVARIELPPLRDRKEDIVILADHFLKKYSNNNITISNVPHGYLSQWIKHDWLGNIRELENRMQEYVLDISEYHFHPAIISIGKKREKIEIQSSFEPLKLYRKRMMRQYEGSYLLRLLEFTHGNISKAAKIAQVNRKNLGLLLKRYGIDHSKLKH